MMSLHISDRRVGEDLCQQVESAGREKQPGSRWRISHETPQLTQCKQEDMKFEGIFNIAPPSAQLLSLVSTPEGGCPSRVKVCFGIPWNLAQRCRSRGLYLKRTLKVLALRPYYL